MGKRTAPYKAPLPSHPLRRAIEQRRRLIRTGAHPAFVARAQALVEREADRVRDIFEAGDHHLGVWTALCNGTQLDITPPGGDDGRKT